MPTVLRLRQPGWWCLFLFAILLAGQAMADEAAAWRALAQEGHMVLMRHSPPFARARKSRVSSCFSS